MSREIRVKKNELIDKIKENKAEHIKDYKLAVIAYAEKAAKVLAEQLLELEKGSLNISISLVSPVDKSYEYDKIIKTFEWEVEEYVTLSQQEFNQYVLDETQFAIQAKFMNSTYKG